MNIQVNLERLKKDILDLSKFGRNPNSGISRPSFSKADLEARNWLLEQINAAGLCCRVDGAGNIFGRLEGNGKTVMTGSHIDTVINGGMYDGSAGVLAGLECLRRIQEEKPKISKPLEVAAFTDEEGNLAGDFLGSRAFAGTLDKDILEKGLTTFGLPLSQILENTEFTMETILSASGQRPETEAFIELHIEQGIVLETESKSIGLVNTIAGKRDWLCSFEGEASHAGTTPFELRHDAFLGLADFALKCTHYAAPKGSGSLITIGKAHIFPGSFSVIPARADFTLDFRSTSAENLEDMDGTFRKFAEEIAVTRGLAFTSKMTDQTEPAAMSQRIMDVMKESCNKLSLPYLELPSGAGHDAQILSSVAETGMIFIPCEDGISHSPEEKINWEDLEKGANLLLQTLIQLAG